MSRGSSDAPSASHSTITIEPGIGSPGIRRRGIAFPRRFSSVLSFGRRPADQIFTEPRNPFGLNTSYRPDLSIPIIADFVFVHGLGGGSNTIWSIKQQSGRFWPGEWLPQDEAFNGVRIHSFGYDANWSSRATNPLDIHAFAQSLMEELLSNPDTKSPNTSIVLIGHSMGGLIIKEVCILLKTNPDFNHLAERLHSFYFLGTPHRGSNLAKMLTKLLRITGRGRRAYVTALEASSGTIHVLNDRFRIHYAGINLHTFYESKPMPHVGIIVDRESATMGSRYPVSSWLLLTVSTRVC